MEQILFDTLLAVPWLPIIAGGAALAGSIFGGGGADKERSEELQNEAIRLERERQSGLEGRFEAMRPLRRQSLTNMLAMGSTENPFSRRLGDDQQAGILASIDQSQASQGLFTDPASRMSGVTRELSDIFEREGRGGFFGGIDTLGKVIEVKKSLMQNFGLGDAEAEKMAKEFLKSGDVSAISNLNLAPQSGGGALF